MRYCTQHWLNRRCREAGGKNGDCDACIVTHGDVLAVDETHPDFPKTVVSGPSIGQKVANLAISAANHIASGMPQATQEQINTRFTICQSCEHFTGNACGLCGCPIIQEKRFLSKLSWANESCPATPPKWGPVNSTDNSEKHI